MLDVLQIGASRAGSTWLWRMLQKHPDVIFPCWGPNAAPGGGPAFSRKSAWFWNNTAPYWKDNHWGQVKPRAVKSLNEYRKWYDENVPGKIKMDITEGAAYIPKSRIQLIKQTYPDVKIVYCIRNPLTTIWSHMRFSHCENMSVNQFLQQRGGNYRRNVEYLKNLRMWENHFSPNIHVYFFNRIGDNPLVLLEELSRFMGIDDTIWSTLPKNEITTIVNSSNKNNMPAKVKNDLVKIFANDIEKIGKRFDQDLSHWLEGKE